MRNTEYDKLKLPAGNKRRTSSEKDDSRKTIFPKKLYLCMQNKKCNEYV